MSNDNPSVSRTAQERLAELVGKVVFVDGFTPRSQVVRNEPKQMMYAGEVTSYNGLSPLNVFVRSLEETAGGAQRFVGMRGMYGETVYDEARNVFVVTDFNNEWPGISLAYKGDSHLMGFDLIKKLWDARSTNSAGGT